MGPSKLHASAKASSFTESVIRDMTRLANLHGAINLGQGFPDFAAPQALKDAAAQAIADDHNQYPITWGVPAFREAIAAKYLRDYGMAVDPETEICVTCGSTEAMIATMLGVLDPGDEVVIFEPFYENYGPDSILSGAVPKLVTLRPPDWTFDEAELRAAFTDRTRAIVINSPNNPTGKVFTREELSLIAELCVAARRDRDHRRDLRAHHLRRREPRADRHAGRHGRAHRDDQRAVEDLLGDGVARGVGDRLPGTDGGHPLRARLPHRCGSRPAAGGGHHRARTPSQLLRGRRRRVRRTPRPDDVDPRRDGVRGGLAGRCLLRHGRLLTPGTGRRRRDRSAPRRARGRGHACRVRRSSPDPRTAPTWCGSRSARRWRRSKRPANASARSS